jgi:hypothetical protein
VLIVAVSWSFRGAAANSATVHLAPPPPGDRRRLTWRARSGLAPQPAACDTGRAGDEAPDGPPVLPSLETIDVTAVGNEIFRLNHAEFATNRVGVDDIN